MAAVTQEGGAVRAGKAINYACLTVFGLIALLLNIAVSSLISKKRMNIARVQTRDAGKLESTTVNGIAMIETIKASDAENGFFQKWAGYQASVNKQRGRSLTN